MKILGMKKKSGEFNGRPWSHTAFYCEHTQADEIQADFGHDVSIVKVKDDAIARQIEMGFDYKFYYDKYGQVVNAVLLD